MRSKHFWWNILVLIVGVGVWFGLRGPGLVDAAEGEPEVIPFRLCDNLRGTDRANCEACAGDDKSRMWTAIGCLHTNATELVPALINFVLGIGGMFLVVQVIISSANIIFASGDSGKIQKARKNIINSVIALLFLVLGITILQIIGVNILSLPGYFGS